MEIEVCERLMDCWYDYSNGGKRMPKYHAQVKGKPGLWGCGRSPQSAIGDLVNSHREVFGVTVTDLGD